MTLHTLSFTTHAGLGVLALATFWIAGLSRDGRRPSLRTVSRRRGA